MDVVLLICNFSAETQITAEPTEGPPARTSFPSPRNEAAKQFLLEEARETGRQVASEDESSCDVDSDDGGNDFDGDEGSDELGHGKNQSTSGRKRYPDNRYPKNVPSPAVPLTRHL